MKLSVHAGAIAPYKLEITVGSESGGFDLTQVTAGAFQILRNSSRKSDVPYTQWAAVLSAAVATSEGTQCTLTHVYELGDVPDPGVIYVRAMLTHPDGPIYSRSFPLLVSENF